uniref:PepSY-like domain-containing protein n=1 Tax=Prevotella sp. TaxID=59823 RepID=UPI00402A4C78
MMKILMMVICCMLSCNMAANAGNDKPISVNALPAKAQTLLSTHFGKQKVMLATVEGVVSKSYDVVLKNGTKLEFDKKGNLTEVECKQGTVPYRLIPQAIKNYLKANYPRQTVKKLEIKKNEYEVELANGLDLTFNNRFKLVDIDRQLISGKFCPIDSTRHRDRLGSHK